MRARWPRLGGADYVVAFLFGIGVALLWFGAAKAATADHRDAWVVVACFAQPIERGCVELSQPLTSRVECQITASRAADLAKGSRVSCQPFQPESRR